MSNANNMPIVYVDMDGVLADLFNHVAEIHDVEHYDHMSREEWDVFFQNTDAYHLFCNLPAFANANELLNKVKKMAGGYRILSSPLNFDKEGSIKGKQDWLAKFITVPADEIVFEHDKSIYATTNGTSNILIDDYRKNITAWKNAGGIGIKYQADENTLEDLISELSEVLR